MFRWFQALMPREDRFFALFNRHADTLVRAGFLLVEDVPRVVEHAERAWFWLMGASAAANRRLTSGGFPIDSSTAGNPR